MRSSASIDPDLPVNDGFYRLVQPRRARGDGDQLHVARAGRRRLGDADAPRRGDVPRAPARLPGPAPGRHEGDDVPGGLRLARRRRRELHVLLRHVRGRLRRAPRERRPGRRAGARAEHRERARRGDRAQLPGQHRRGSRSSRTPRGRAASAAGSGCARTTASTCTRPSPCSPTATGIGPWGAAGGRSGRVAEYVHVRDGVETRLGSKSTIDLVPGDVISVRSCGGGGYGPPGSATPSASCATCSRARSAAERARDEYLVVDRPTTASTWPQRPS